MSGGSGAQNRPSAAAPAISGPRMGTSIGRIWCASVDEMSQGGLEDPISGEVFSRIVGRRQRPTLGAPPERAARDAMAKMARFPTGAPKGVFRYRTHDEANRHRETWELERALASERAADVALAREGAEPSEET